VLVPERVFLVLREHNGVTPQVASRGFFPDCRCKCGVKWKKKSQAEGVQE